MSGYTGITGPWGTQGSQGSTGATGLQGLQGPTGVQGRFILAEQSIFAQTADYTDKQVSLIQSTVGRPLLVSGESISINGKIDSNSYNNYSDSLTLYETGHFQVPAGNFFIRVQTASPVSVDGNTSLAGYFIAMSTYNPTNSQYTDVAYGTLVGGTTGIYNCGISRLHHYVSQTSNQTYAIRIYLGNSGSAGTQRVGANDWSTSFPAPTVSPGPNNVPSVITTIIKLF